MHDKGLFTARFWGVRGSIPCPGPDTVVYGGNTSCIEIRVNDRLFIIDFGSGARLLGDWLIANDLKKNGKISADVFLSHTHWDHIMGFLMFSPIYITNVELRITGPSPDKDTLKGIFEAQFSHNYWPVSIDELTASIKYKQIKETTLKYDGGINVTSIFLNHPTDCLGYRFDYQGKSIALIFDHEQTSAEGNEKITNFVKNTDILIHDAQYAEEEYPTHTGWGHSTMEHAVKTAADAGVKKLILFHHDPSHTDSQLEQFEKKFAGNKVEIAMAKEGMILEV
ncbi:MAG: MBL fold metallo-hydrolase [Treponema sp.]|nr:MBL fold metallo-hydrolase [Treponema sp.]MCL2250690.1 MBL fold metallo-hydrolase [Treponema sp.]